MDSYIKKLKNLLKKNEVIRKYDLEKAEEIHFEEIIQAYEQGYRDGQNGANLAMHRKDISEFSNAKDYYNEKFK
jgi:hypothetical protein